MFFKLHNDLQLNEFNYLAIVENPPFLFVLNSLTDLSPLKSAVHFVHSRFKPRLDHEVIDILSCRRYRYFSLLRKRRAMTKSNPTAINT
ncbi:CLUMA_CG021133, isoform A [Clunio marinus]|uniref:CLUMA_CG021133, isoform A n=1 Tax=Clunio marinus TaxID=568069 RepID=A0A1J1J6R2_9DIPT|nr:CLUMA_CG021133, isoform A [Clunio marinus]